MNYRLMLYTCRVKCFDGITRWFQRTGYFTSTFVLRHQLARWNGCNGPAGEPYQFFETPDQAFQNDWACGVSFQDLPAWNVFWYGPCGHHHEWKEL